MSLINKMLNELEKNKKDDDIARNEALASVNPILRKHQGTFSWHIIFWAIILALFAGVIWHYRTQINLNLARAVTTVKNKTLAIATKSQTAINQQKSAIKLQNIVLEQKNDQTILDLILTNPVVYYLEHVSEQQLTITLNKTTILGNLPVNLENSFIIAFNTKQNKNDTVITLTLLPGTKIATLQLIDKPQPHLHLVFSNPQITTNNKMSKTPTPTSPEEQIGDHYQDILELITQNKIQEAIPRLHLFVGDYPNHLPAREMLVSLLIREGNIKKADEVLMVGLNKTYDYHPFIKLKAHILIKQGHPTQAIDLLQQHSATANDPEYLALLAALYQQQGHFIEAAELYDQLVKVQPQKTIWWLGLGIALESANKINAAKEAYQNAYNYSDVPPELMSFLKDKMKK